MNRQVKVLLEIDKLRKQRLAKKKKEEQIAVLEAKLDRNLRHYYRLRVERSGTATASVIGGVCQGCGMHYPDTHSVMRDMK
ncbi:MAG: hypothetical protein HKN20_04500, partial [Gemmatimonadetes bacterium]|nr:hypothetical protein [Gemmatimonadota bacterium]